MNEQHVMAADMHAHVHPQPMHTCMHEGLQALELAGTAARPSKHMCIASAHCTIASVTTRVVLDLHVMPLTGHPRVLQGALLGYSDLHSAYGLLTGFQTVLRDDERGMQWALGSACRWRLRYSRGDHGYSRGT